MTFDNRVTELIAIGASVAANCQSCVEYHLAKAAEYGIEQNELGQAVEIGRSVRKGAASKVDQAADRLLNQDSSAADSATSGQSRASEAGCCASVFEGTAAADAAGLPRRVPNSCMLFGSKASGWSGGFPFGGCQDQAKS